MSPPTFTFFGFIRSPGPWLEPMIANDFWLLTLEGWQNSKQFGPKLSSKNSWWFGGTPMLETPICVYISYIFNIKQYICIKYQKQYGSGGWHAAWPFLLAKLLYSFRLFFAEDRLQERFPDVGLGLSHDVGTTSAWSHRWSCMHQCV